MSTFAAPFDALAPTLSAFHEASAAPRRVFARAAAEGFRLVQLSAAQEGFRPRELGRSARRDLLGALRSNGVAPSGVDLFVPRADLTDPNRVDRAVACLLEAVTLAEDLGRVPLSISLGADLPAIADRLAEEGRCRGVRIADHAIGSDDVNGLEIGVDSAAILASNGDPAAILEQAGARAASVRLSDLKLDGTRGPLGDGRSGRLDTEAFAAAVAALSMHHTMPVVIDARRWHDPWTAVRLTAEAWIATPAMQMAKRVRG